MSLAFSVVQLNESVNLKVLLFSTLNHVLSSLPGWWSRLPSRDAPWVESKWFTIQNWFVQPKCMKSLLTIQGIDVCKRMIMFVKHQYHWIRKGNASNSIEKENEISCVPRAKECQPLFKISVFFSIMFNIDKYEIPLQFLQTLLFIFNFRLLK
jgi:hypothetical protein